MVLANSFAVSQRLSFARRRLQVKAAPCPRATRVFEPGRRRVFVQPTSSAQPDLSAARILVCRNAPEGDHSAFSFTSEGRRWVAFDAGAADCGAAPAARSWPT